MESAEQAIEAAASETSEFIDPRALLADWANTNDEWTRLLVSEVIATGRPVDTSTIAKAYQIFRQEKALDKRELPAVAKLDIEARQDESAPPLTLMRLSDVHGVNALVPGAVIEPHEGLTILYGEKGTGKTGYSRIFKALANSRTADCPASGAVAAPQGARSQITPGAGSRQWEPHGKGRWADQAGSCEGRPPTLVIKARVGHRRSLAGPDVGSATDGRRGAVR
jgi:hypothetical protein